VLPGGPFPEISRYDSGTGLFDDQSGQAESHQRRAPPQLNKPLWSSKSPVPES